MCSDQFNFVADHHHNCCLYIIQNQINNYVSHCSSIIFCDVNPEMYQSVSRIDNQRKIIMKEYLEENFGIDVQMKVLDFEF